MRNVKRCLGDTDVKNMSRVCVNLICLVASEPYLTWKKFIITWNST